MKLLLSEVQGSRIPEVLGIPACDSRFLQIVNEAQQRLVMGPEHWWDLRYKYALTVTEGLITWPREIAAIESVAVCCMPIPIRNEWFEFLEAGYGLRNCEGECACEAQLFARGESPLMDDLDGDRKMKVYGDVTESGSAQLTVFGYDDNDNWVRTNPGGNWQDGESILIAVGGTLGTKTFSRITGVSKPVTNGIVRLYQYNAADASQSVIGIYQWDETVPRYRRSYLGSQCSEDETTVTVMAKREFVAARNAADILMIGNLPALKEMCQGVQKRDRGLLQEAMVHEAEAYRLMDREAQHYLGTGSQVPMRVEAETWNAGTIEHIH